MCSLADLPAKMTNFLAVLSFLLATSVSTYADRLGFVHGDCDRGDAHHFALDHNHRMGAPGDQESDTQRLHCGANSLALTASFLASLQSALKAIEPHGPVISVLASEVSVELPPPRLSS